jgi:hypothetical protein
MIEVGQRPADAASRPEGVKQGAQRRQHRLPGLRQH